MRTKKLVTGAAVAAALVLSACGGGGGSAKPEGPIGFFTDKAAWEPSFDDMNKASGDLQLTFTGYSDPVAYDSYIKQAFRTADKPDLFTWHTGGQLEELVEQGLVAETSDIWAQAEADGLVPEGLKDQFTYDGKQYCVPLNVVYWAVYYNKAIFAEHNLEVPKTWADMENVTKTLRDAGVTPFHQMNIIFEFVYFQALLAGQNTDTYLGILDGKSSYLDDDVTKIMEQWQTMMKRGDFIDPGVTGDPQALLMNGDVAMAYFGTFFTGQLTAIDAKSGEDYGIFMMPNFNPANSDQPMVLESGPLCVGEGSKNQEAALEYSKWWLSTDAQTAWTTSRGDVSFNPNVEISDPELKTLVDSVTGEGSDNIRIIPRYLEGSPKPVYVLSTELFGDFVTNADNPRNVQEKLQAEAEKYWSSK